MENKRLAQLNGHFEAQPTNTFNAGKVLPPSDDDVVVVATARTAMTRAKKGAQRNTAPEAMLAPVMKDVLRKANNLDPKLLGEICIGNVLQGGSGAASSRMAQFLADIPEDVPLYVVNRMCSSGLQAVMSIANQIASGQIEIGMGGGVESMSLFPMQGMVDPSTLSEKVFEHEKANLCLMPMGITSENVVAKYGITRQQQDQMAVESHQKAARAQKEGWSKDEITVYTTTVTDKDGEHKEVVVDMDDGVRGDTTLEGLGKLKPAFKKDGSTTAGNSSQVTDGAAVVILARRSAAKRLGLPILGRVLSYAVAGVPPEIMGIGPAFAIPKALEKAGLTINDIDVYEVNEAFASQATWCVEHLKIPKDRLNRRGGAIALGHPLGMTGARMVCTLFSELKRTNQKTGVISMCIGTGMGAAGIFERE
jgi:acetyl-CoA acyltransferase 1